MLQLFKFLLYGSFTSKKIDSSTESLRLIRAARKMLVALEECQTNGTVAGIYSPALGEGMFVTGIESIYVDRGEKVIVLKRYDLGGNILPRTHFSINEINAVCVMNATYENPFVESMAG